MARHDAGRASFGAPECACGVVRPLAPPPPLTLPVGYRTPAPTSLAKRTRKLNIWDSNRHLEFSLISTTSPDSKNKGKGEWEGKRTADSHAGRGTPPL